MIISHKYQFIFFKTKKTGGTSFEIALRNFLGEDDIATPIAAADEQLCTSYNIPGPQNYMLELENSRKYTLFNHIRANTLKSLLNDEIWRTYFKFSILRNPFDCLVSNYYWAIKKKKKKYTPTFNEWVMSNPNVMVENKNIISVDYHSVLDFVINYESLRNDIYHLENIYPGLKGLYNTFDSIKAKSNIRPSDEKQSVSNIFSDNPEIAQLVYILCANDIKEYGYHPF